MTSFHELSFAAMATPPGDASPVLFRASQPSRGIMDESMQGVPGFDDEAAMDATPDREPQRNTDAALSASARSSDGCNKRCQHAQERVQGEGRRAYVHRLL